MNVFAKPPQPVPLPEALSVLRELDAQQDGKAACSFMYTLNVITGEEARKTQSDKGETKESPAPGQDQPGEQGTQSPATVEILPVLSLWGDPAGTQQRLNVLKDMFGERGYLVQQDQGMLKALMLCSLPHGLRTDRENVEQLARSHRVSLAQLDCLAPLDAVFSAAQTQALAATLRGRVTREAGDLEGPVRKRIARWLNRQTGSAEIEKVAARVSVPADTLRDAASENGPPLDLETLKRLSAHLGQGPRGEAPGMDYLLMGKRTLPVAEAALRLGLGPRMDPLLSNPYSSRQDVLKTSRRTKLSQYLPWKGFRHSSATDDYMYRNANETIGFLWRCSPRAFDDGSKDSQLEAIFKHLDLPDGTCLQFTLFADDNVDHVVAEYLRDKVHAQNDAVAQKMLSGFAQYIRAGTQGVDKLSGIPIREFHMFAAASLPADKVPDRKVADTYRNIQSRLQEARLNPQPVAPGLLVQWLRRIFNPYNPYDYLWSDDKDLRDQVLLSDTSIIRDPHKLTFRYADGTERVVRGITPRQWPKEVDPLLINKCFGGFMGRRERFRADRRPVHVHPEPGAGLQAQGPHPQTLQLHPQAEEVGLLGHAPAAQTERIRMGRRPGGAGRGFRKGPAVHVHLGGTRRRPSRS